MNRKKETQKKIDYRQDTSHLIPLGWNQSFQNHIEKHGNIKHSLARVSAVDRGRYTVTDENGDVFAWITGKLKHSIKNPIDYPIVGDWVWVRHSKSGNPSKIVGLLPRNTTLKRKSAGRRIEYQYIAANIDYVFIMVSCFFDFNLRRLERYLSIVKESGIPHYILLTKTDLVNREVLNAIIKEIDDNHVQAPVIPLSHINGEGLGKVETLIKHGKTYCMMGSSGVGKSTFINHFIPENMDALKTGEVMDSGEGRHTTVRRTLIHTNNGALFIDTPGMREMGLLSNEEGILGSFSDIFELSKQCHFSDCTHTSEPKCAVKDAVESGVISEGHYSSYLMLKAESKSNAEAYYARQKGPLCTLKPDPTSTKHKNQMMSDR